MKKILQYINERFPLLPVILFSLGYASLAIGIIFNRNPWLEQANSTLKTLVLLTSTFFFFLLRQRVIDEFKDFQHDVANFPNRPLPRGLISKKQLIGLGMSALFLEWTSVYLLGADALLFYLPVFLYSLLMAKEFFLPRWLNRHFNLYFLSHELIFLLFGLFFILIINAGRSPETKDFFFQMGVLIMAPVGVEVVRKFSPRYDEKGRVVQDSYSVVWGRNTALVILASLSLLLGLLLSIIKTSYLFLAVSLLWSTIIVAGGKKSDKMAVLSSVTNFLACALLSNLIWR